MPRSITHGGALPRMGEPFAALDDTHYGLDGDDDKWMGKVVVIEFKLKPPTLYVLVINKHQNICATSMVEKASERDKLIKKLS